VKKTLNQISARADSHNKEKKKATAKKKAEKL